MRLVTGMHRSGTSLIARLLFEAGADFGDPATFYRPDRWNPDGYFEQPEIHAVNMPLVHGILGRLAYFVPPSTRTVLRRARRRAAQIRAAADRYNQKVVKDCRYCLTLPAWLDQETSVEGILVCLRDPIAVARSLRKRNRITLRHAYRLWLIHIDRLLEGARDIPLWFVDYGRLFDKESFLDEMKPVMEFFGLRLSTDELVSLYNRCVNPELNHSRDAKAIYPNALEARWRDLLELHENQFRALRASTRS